MARIYFPLFGILCISASLFLSCEKEEFPFYSGQGKRPVYAPVSELSDVRNLNEQPVEETGPIFLLDTLFFMIEQKKGIHVYNVKDSANVAYVTFLKIPAVTDFAIAGGRLYADSWRDLVTIDITDVRNIVVLDREADIFSPLLYPPLFNGPFECIDESQGAVVGWEDGFVENVRCHTIN